MTTTDGPLAAANRPAAGPPALEPGALPGLDEPAWSRGQADRTRGGGDDGPAVLFQPPRAAGVAVGQGGAARSSGRSVGQETRSQPGGDPIESNRALSDHQKAQAKTIPMLTTTTNTPTETISKRQNPKRQTPALDLLESARRPDVDPCDLAIDAMPGHIVGDLTPPEDAWLLAHTGGCTYCRNVLHRYERVDEMLDRLQRYLDPLPAPPPFRPPAAVRTARPRGVGPASQRRASYGTIESPIGPLRVAVSDAGVCEIGFAVNESEDEFRTRLEERGFRPDACLESDLGPEGMARVTRQLEEYFGGKRDRFDLPLDFSGVSPFTKSVLTATAAVPFGHLATYRDIATKIGAPRATRAVGNALGRNPIPVIVPCHRIVRSDHTLGGYTGGPGIKERLLDIEGVAPLQ